MDILFPIESWYNFCENYFDYNVRIPGISIYGPYEEMLDWILNRMGEAIITNDDNEIISDGLWAYTGEYFFFKNKDDATLFKLTWK